MAFLNSNKRIREESESTNYWKSTSDMLAALLLIVMLIMMVILINLFDKSSELNEFTSNYDPGAYDNDYDAGYGAVTYPDDGLHGRYDHTDGGGGGSRDVVPENDYTGYYDEPVSYQYDDGLDTSAVYVVVKDYETKAAILNEEISFRLYDAEGVIQALSTYYPSKITYDTYATTESGSFYVPEKIKLGTYSLSQISDIEGYDRAARTEFTIDEYHPWNEPYVVTVNVSPSKNTVKILLTDSFTGAGLSGVEFKLYAEHDIYTADGTLRFKQGQLAGTILTDINGYGESTELYLGNYRLEQTQIPFGYASARIPGTVSIGKKDSKASAKVEISCDKTRVELQLTDELKESKAINGVLFALADSTGTETILETSESGSISITDLEKDTAYVLTQLTFADGYDTTSKSTEFYVDTNGYISGESTLELKQYNRILRAELLITDSLLKKAVENIDSELLDENGNTIAHWVSGRTPYYIEGIQPGTYYVSLSGDKGTAHPIEILSTASVQRISIGVLTDSGKIMIGIGAAAAAAVLIVLLSTVKRRKK